MKTKIVALAMLLATTAHAEISNEVASAINSGEISSDTYARCLVKGEAIGIVVGLRDSGSIPPQMAYQKASGYARGMVDDAYLKRMVNAVYFEPRAKYLNPKSLADADTNKCLDPRPQVREALPAGAVIEK